MRIAGAFFFLITYIIFISSWHDFNTKKMNPAAIPFSYFIFPTRYNVLVSLTLSVLQRTKAGGKLTFVSTRAANTVCPVPSRDRRFHFKRRIPPCPQRRALRHLPGASNAHRHRPLPLSRLWDGAVSRTQIKAHCSWCVNICRRWVTGFNM